MVFVSNIPVTKLKVAPVRPKFVDLPNSLTFDFLFKKYHFPLLKMVFIGGSRGGGHAGCTPPHGTQFFHFYIHFCQKVPMLEVHVPPNGSTPPYGKSWIRHWYFCSIFLLVTVILLFCICREVNCISTQQESRKAYGTAVSGVVIHMN